MKLNVVLDLIWGRIPLWLRYKIWSCVLEGQEATSFLSSSLLGAKAKKKKKTIQDTETQCGFGPYQGQNEPQRQEHCFIHKAIHGPKQRGYTINRYWSSQQFLETLNQHSQFLLLAWRNQIIAKYHSSVVPVWEDCHKKIPKSLWLKQFLFS